MFLLLAYLADWKLPSTYHVPGTVAVAKSLLLSVVDLAGPGTFQTGRIRT